MNGQINEKKRRKGEPTRSGQGVYGIEGESCRGVLPTAAPDWRNKKVKPNSMKNGLFFLPRNKEEKTNKQKRNTNTNTIKQTQTQL